MRWFENCADVNEVRSLYRTLAKRYHPDLGGDQETMKQVNLAYEAALKGMNGQASMGSDGKEHTYYYNEAMERDLMAKFAEVLKLKMNGVTVEILGVWIWATGNTRPYKDALKGLGFLWHAKRVAWYWRKQGYRKNPSHLSLDEIRRLYGVQASTRYQEDGLSVA